MSRSNSNIPTCGTANARAGTVGRLFVAETNAPTENLAEFFKDTPQEGPFHKREASQKGISFVSNKLLTRYAHMVESVMKKYDFLDRDNKLTQALAHPKASKFICFLSNVIYHAGELQDSLRAIGIEYKKRINGRSSQNWTTKLDNLVTSETCWRHVQSLFAEAILEHNMMKEVIDNTLVDGNLKPQAKDDNTVDGNVTQTPHAAEGAAMAVDSEDDDELDELLNYSADPLHVVDGEFQGPPGNIDGARSLDQKPPPAKKRKHMPKQMTLFQAFSPKGGC